MSISYIDKAALCRLLQYYSIYNENTASGENYLLVNQLYYKIVFSSSILLSKLVLKKKPNVNISMKMT